MRICIIGGGTAGWLAALWITKMQKGQHSVTVIESSKINIIGAGEGTTGHFSGIIKNTIGNFGIDEAEFMRETGASHKMGIQFINWRGDNSEFIAPIDNTPILSNSEWDYLMMYHYLYGDPDRVHLATVCGQLAEYNASTYNKSGTESYGFCAYHFDGHLVGKYFKKLAAPHCQAVIDSEFQSAETDTNGRITSIKLTNGQEIQADWYIDASGFARILAPYVGNSWHSYKDYLTCDRAVPFLRPHTPGKPIRPLTQSRAMKSGWMWSIPTQDRNGCGYVYDSTCTTYEDVLAELEQHFGEPVTPIKLIKFEPGRLTETFCKNVMFIGLSGIFLEPLQATSIHGTISQLQCFHNMILRPDSVPQDDLQNKRANQLLNRGFDQFADLIQLHYRSGRNDTEFWRKQQQLPLRPTNQYIYDLAKRRWPHAYDWELNWSSAGYGVFIYPMMNYGLFDIEQIASTLNPSLKAAYDRWMDKAQRIRQDCMSHTDMIEKIKQGQIKNLRYTDQASPPPKRTGQQLPHPLLRF